jgi:OOP family OmpA-OmpF porin
MRQLLTSLCATSVLALAAGCSTPVVDKLENTEPAQRDAFNRQLTEEYKLLAKFEADEMQDYFDAGHFAEKGLKAARNQPTQPDEVWSRDLPKDKRPELVDAHERLMEAYAHDAKHRYPMEAAVAQAKFDCWLEQQEENYQPEHIAACRKAFRTALNAMYAKEQAFIDSQQQTVVVARSADRAPITRKAVVYFDFDDATIPAREKDKLDTVADSVKGMNGSYTLIAIGHADRAGGYDYNEDLSVRRAESVRKALIDRGIEPSVIVVDGKGEMAPAEPTGDGVREQGNRRVQIGIRKPPA